MMEDATHTLYFLARQKSHYRESGVRTRSRPEEAEKAYRSGTRARFGLHRNPFDGKCSDEMKVMRWGLLFPAHGIEDGEIEAVVLYW